MAYNALTTSGKFLTHIRPMFDFYHLETSEYHRVFIIFQGSKNEILADNGLRPICVYKYKSLVVRIKWNYTIGKPRRFEWIFWISGMLLKATWRSLTLSIWNVIIDVENTWMGKSSDSYEIREGIHLMDYISGFFRLWSIFYYSFFVTATKSLNSHFLFWVFRQKNEHSELR